MDHPLTHLRNLASNQAPNGMVAVCSAHPLVLRAAMQLSRKTKGILLVEATANQVNPAGGYSGMTPGDFAEFVAKLSKETGLPRDRILIGADHLGPHVWNAVSDETAMQQAEKLARQCAQAGFCKIHLDTVTGQTDPPQDPSALATAARRAAALCRAAEDAAGSRANPEALYYVIGTDVPPPGGGLEKDQVVKVTPPDQLQHTIDLFERAFRAAGLEKAWQRVIGVVVQPGVEFGDLQVAPYQPQRAAALSAYHARLPGSMTYEIHAADYQQPDALSRMVRDRFNLIKVGPCLTFALRETLYALSAIEEALPNLPNRANLVQVMEQVMYQAPEHWRHHYQGSAEELRFLLHYSLRDRIRYYWALPPVRRAVKQLMDNLSRPIPAALLQQYLPDLYPDIAPSVDPVHPQAIIEQRIQNALAPYADICRPQ